MRLRLGTTESVLLVAGIAGLLEQELVRVLLRLSPSTVISGICFAFVLIGAGVTLSRNFTVGPVTVEMKDPPEERRKKDGTE